MRTINDLEKFVSKHVRFNKSINLQLSYLIERYLTYITKIGKNKNNGIDYMSNLLSVLEEKYSSNVIDREKELLIGYEYHDINNEIID